MFDPSAAKIAAAMTASRFANATRVLCRLIDVEGMATIIDLRGREAVFAGLLQTQCVAVRTMAKNKSHHGIAAHQQDGCAVAAPVAGKNGIARCPRASLNCIGSCEWKIDRQDDEIFERGSS
jgi:hypothetical protein